MIRMSNRFFDYHTVILTSLLIMGPSLGMRQFTSLAYIVTLNTPLVYLIINAKMLLNLLPLLHKFHMIMEMIILVR
jgi:hypothetical protein